MPESPNQPEQPILPMEEEVTRDAYEYPGEGPIFGAIEDQPREWSHLNRLTSFLAEGGFDVPPRLSEIVSELQEAQTRLDETPEGVDKDDAAIDLLVTKQEALDLILDIRRLPGQEE